MRFREKTTNNKHDSRQEVQDRLVTYNGVKKRCELTLYGFLRFREQGYISVGMMVAHLNERFDNAYSEGDIAYVCHRLVKEGLLNKRGHGAQTEYRASANALEKWRATEKEMI